MRWGSWASRCLLAILASCGPPRAEDVVVHSTSTSTAGGAEPAEVAGASEAASPTCEVEVVWYTGQAVSGTASADTRREADELAWTRACEALEAQGRGDCARGEVAAVERIHRRDGAAYLSEVQLHPGHRRTERASSPEGFSAACEAAVATACPEGDCVVTSIEGVPVGMILASDDAVDEAAPGECSVELQITLAEAEGNGSGSDTEEAEAAAMAEACRALGAEDCADDDAYVVPLRALSMRFASGERSATVRIRLRHVRFARGHARSETSRLDACRAAAARACGDEGCPTEPGATRLFRVDGVRVHDRGPPL